MTRNGEHHLIQARPDFNDVRLSQFTRGREPAVVSEMASRSLFFRWSPRSDRMQRFSRMCFRKLLATSLISYITLYREFFLSFSYLWRPDNLSYLCASGQTIRTFHAETNSWFSAVRNSRYCNLRLGACGQFHVRCKNNKQANLCNRRKYRMHPRRHVRSLISQHWERPVTY
jgi:hypothetical protein